jgi:hypothetical protein
MEKRRLVEIAPRKIRLPADGSGVIHELTYMEDIAASWHVSAILGS